MTEPTPGIPAQMGADAAADAGSSYTPGSTPTFATAAAPESQTASASASTEFPVRAEQATATAAPASDGQASLAVFGPSGSPADAPTTSDRANQLVDRAGDAISDAADKAHEVIGEAAEKAGEALSEAAHNAVTRLRNNATLPAARGRTTIANEVVEKIAGIAAREVPGVHDLGGDVARVFTAVRERLHLGEESAAQGVSVKLEGKTAEIEVTIVIEFGFQVYSVTDKVREKVISSVENLLGLEVTGVDVTVDDVYIPDEGPVGNDQERAATYTAETKAIVVGESAQS
jgi:uncharacterized alkaline shock family protein YloU